MRENRTKTIANLHLLQEPRQGLQPGHGLDVLLCVHDSELGTKLGDDRSSAPAVLQGQILITETTGRALPQPPQNSTPSHLSQKREVFAQSFLNCNG